MKVLYLIAALLMIAVVYDFNHKVGALLTLAIVLSMYIVYKKG